MHMYAVKVHTIATWRVTCEHSSAARARMTRYRLTPYSLCFHSNGLIDTFEQDNNNERYWSMFKRRRSQRVHPGVEIQDTYLKRRYEDLSVCIHVDIKNGRGQYNYYAPWLELKLQPFPAFYREKHSVLIEHDLPIKVEPSRKLTPKISVAKPSTFVSSSDHVTRVPKDAWILEDKDNELGMESRPTAIPINITAKGSDAVAIPNLAAEDHKDRGNFPAQVGASEIESFEPEEQSSAVAVQANDSMSLKSQESQSEREREGSHDQEVADDQEANSTQKSLPVAQFGSSVRSRLCTIL